MKKLMILLGPSGIGKSTVEKNLYNNYICNVLTVYGKRDKRDNDLKYEFITENLDKKLLTYYSKDGYEYALDKDELVDGVNIISIISNSSTNIITDYCKEYQIEYSIVYLSNTIPYIRNALETRGDKDIEKRITFIANDDALNEYKSISIMYRNYNWEEDYNDVLNEIIRTFNLKKKKLTIDSIKVEKVAFPCLYNDYFIFKVLDIDDVTRDFLIRYNKENENVIFNTMEPNDVTLSFKVSDLYYLLNIKEINQLILKIIAVIPIGYIKYINLLRKETKGLTYEKTNSN